MVRPMGNVLALPPFKEMVVGFLQAQGSSRWRSQVREEGESTVKGKRCGGQGLRTATELPLTLTPGSPWTPGDPDSPGSPYKERSIKVPHTS